MEKNKEIKYDRPKISVIIPVYNGEKYLKDCMDSILSQTFLNFELLVVDDGSSDSTPLILADYAGKDSRVRVITQKNAGVSAARNHALDLARGEYLTFLDADDWTDQDTLEKALSLADVNDADVVMWNKVHEYPNGPKVIPYYDAERLICGENQISDMRWQMFTEFDSTGRRIYGTRSACAKLVRRSVIEEHHLRFDEKLRQHEDMLFSLEVYEYTNSLYVTNAAWYHRRVEEGSASSRYASYVVDNNAAAALHMERFLKERRKDAAYFDFFKSILVYWLLQDFDLFVFHKQNPMSEKERYQEARRILKTEPFATAFRTMPKHPLVIRSKRVYIWLAGHRLVHVLAAYSRLYKWARIKRRSLSRN